MKLNIKKQTGRGPWTDEAGNQVDGSMITKKDKVNETVTYGIAKKAMQVNKQLVALKLYIMQCVDEAVAAFHKEYKGKKTEFKGNYTITNFDQSIKVIVKVSQPIKFDDMLIEQAKNKLHEFLNDGISSEYPALKSMVLAAFETSRGRMDVKKILALKRYADQISDKRYKDAMKLIDKAIRRPNTATYHQVEIRNADGKYETVKLNLADV